MYAGEIDEVRVWNAVRSQGQIQSNMYLSLVGNEPGLMGYWRLDEGSGQEVFDGAHGSSIGVLGATVAPDLDDPAWVTSSIPMFADGFEVGDLFAWSSFTGGS